MYLLTSPRVVVIVVFIVLAVVAVAIIAIVVVVVIVIAVVVNVVVAVVVDVATAKTMKTTITTTRSEVSKHESNPSHGDLTSRLLDQSFHAPLSTTGQVPITLKSNAEDSQWGVYGKVCCECYRRVAVVVVARWGEGEEACKPPTTATTTTTTATAATTATTATTTK